MPDLFRTIVRPLLTERSARQLEEGVYTFEVAPEANKFEVRLAVEKLFNVKVADVRTMNYAGKQRRVGTRTGRRAHWKKALVKLQPGQTIELFEGV